MWLPSTFCVFQTDSVENALVSKTSDVSVRLVDGTAACSGRVEIYKDSEWGTICDEGLDDVEGNLVCYEAGCGPLISIQPSAFFGEGSGSLLTDDLNCSGNESSVLNCNWGTKPTCVTTLKMLESSVTVGYKIIHFPNTLKKKRFQKGAL